MAQSSSHEIGKQFIEAFISEIVQNIKVESTLFDKERLAREVKRIEEETFSSLRELRDGEEHESIFKEHIPIQAALPQLQEKRPEPQAPPRPSFQSSSLRELLSPPAGSFRSPLLRRPFPRPIPPRPAPVLQAPPPQPPKIQKSEEKSKETHTTPANRITIDALVKITPFLLDPAIQTIECPGPGKQITVSRSGYVQNTNIFLTTEEIKNIMDEISQKTRIPIIPGIFKAGLNDYVVTSVISEFVGTRFMIQRKQAEVESKN